ncbi:MAG: immunoglobulin domain-containing protein [Verrucomicrobiales bacterium]|nr:immunoglobulin domain-containing protein [Verrucomicrobiales bacterium]
MNRRLLKLLCQAFALVVGGLPFAGHGQVSPTLLNDLQDVTVQAGQRAVLRVTLQSSANRIYYQWTKVGVSLNPFLNRPEFIITNAYSRHAGQYQVEISFTDVLPRLTTTSRVATLTVRTASDIIITSQPQDTIVERGNPASLSVTATSSRPLSYRWYRNDYPVALASQPILTFTNSTTSDSGDYKVVISDEIDEFESRLTRFLVHPGPIFTLHPQNVAVRRGSTVSFTAAASGRNPPSYTWDTTARFPPGTVTNQATLVLSHVTQAQVGYYYVQASDSVGLTRSGGASLVILPEITYASPPYVAALAAGRNGEYGDLNGPALSSRWRYPNSGFVAPNGDVYLADTGNHRLKKFTPKQQVVLVAGSGRSGYLDGPALTSRFQDPLGICADAGGTVYVADSGNHRLRKVTPDGAVSTLAGSGAAGGADGPASTSQFNYPNDLALARDGTLYVSEFHGHRIRRVAPDGTVSTVAGTGTAGWLDGPRSTALLDRPGGIALDAAGNIYFTEWGSHRVRKIGTNDLVSTLAGTGEPGYIDGPGTSALLHNPDGIVVAPDGAVVFVDRENHAVRRVSPHGLVETVLGNGFSGSGLGSIATAQMNLPSGLGFAADGSFYVADTENLRLLHLIPEAGVPALLTQPQDTFVPQGQKLTLQVEALGVDQLSYQWFRDAQTLQDQTNATLVLGPLRLSDSGKYSVAVQDRRGTTRSREALVTVVPSEGPVITSQPQTVFALPGDPVVLSVGATGTGPLEYQWRYESGNDIVGERGPTLTLTPARRLMVGRYSVLIRDSVGSVTSSWAQLVLRPCPAPVIDSSPTNLFLRQGASAPLRVDAQGTGPLRRRWWWRSPTYSKWFVIHESMEPVLNLDGSAYTEGTYWVEVQDYADQTAATPWFTVTLAPALGPYVTVQPPDGLTEKWGEPIRLRVVAEGADPILYQWYQGSTAVPGANGPELLIPKLTTATFGTYHVKVSDVSGHTSSSSPCYVQIASPVYLTFVLSPSNIVANAGSAARFVSEAIPYDRSLRYQWFFEGIRIPGANSPSLVIDPVTPADVGHYWAKVNVATFHATSLVARLDLPPVIRPSTPARTVSTAAGQPSPGDGFGIGTNAAFRSPTGLAVGPSGLLFIADTDNHRIKQRTPEGVVQATAGRGGQGNLDGQASSALFRTPHGLTFVPTSGALLVADTANHLLRSISASGQVETVAGRLDPTNVVDGPAATAQIPRPVRLAHGPDGALYFTSDGGSSVRRLTIAGVIETYAGSTSAGHLDGPRLDARFQGLGGLAFDPNGNLLIAETDGHRIRRISPDGQATTLAGSPQGAQGYADDTGTNARFRFPQGIALDPAGNLAVADSGNHALRLVSPDGVVTTLAGTGSPGDADGPAVAASFRSPADVVVMPDGAVYVADTGNHMIRRIGPPSGLRLTFGRATSSEPFTLSWPSGILQSAPTPLGPWTSLPEVPSPYILSPSGTPRFFRARSE